MKQLWKYFVITLFMVFFGLSGQTAEVCSHDCSQSEKQTDTLHADSAHHLEPSGPVDCDCTTHNHSCCSHFLMFFAQAPSAVSKVERLSETPCSLPSHLLPSPYLDGPFQPPRA